MPFSGLIQARKLYARVVVVGPFMQPDLVRGCGGACSSGYHDIPTLLRYRNRQDGSGPERQLLEHGEIPAVEASVDGCRRSSLGGAGGASAPCRRASNYQVGSRIRALPGPGPTGSCRAGPWRAEKSPPQGGFRGDPCPGRGWTSAAVERECYKCNLERFSRSGEAVAALGSWGFRDSGRIEARTLQVPGGA